MILHNAAYLQASWTKWRAAGYDITDEQIRHIYPLFHHHILLHGVFHFDNDPELITASLICPFAIPADSDYDVLV